MAVALSRILKATNLIHSLPTFDHGFYYATLLDAVVMCAIVCIRAISVRDERDKAILANSLLFEYATTDPLTGLLNRRALTEGYKDQIFAPEQRRARWAMLLFDLDHFKSINDRFGHNVGDRCLAQFAKILEQCCRTGDICARIGGEEFVILTTVGGREDAEAIATRIRTTTAEQQFGDPQTNIGKITTSIGVAMIPHSVPIAFDTIYRLADQVLYAAKSGGRNRVTMSELSATFGKRWPVDVKGNDSEVPMMVANEGRVNKL